MPADAPEPLLTSDELAALLQVSERTLRRWRSEGRIQAIVIGRTVRFRLSEALPERPPSKELFS